MYSTPVYCYMFNYWGEIFGQKTGIKRPFNVAISSRELFFGPGWSFPFFPDTQTQSWPFLCHFGNREHIAHFLVGLSWANRSRRPEITIFLVVFKTVSRWPSLSTRGPKIRPAEVKMYPYSGLTPRVPWGPIFRRVHGMPWLPNGSLNVSGSCLTIFRCLYDIKIDMSI